jgi:hypothetical protein
VVERVIVLLVPKVVEQWVVEESAVCSQLVPIVNSDSTVVSCNFLHFVQWRVRWLVVQLSYQPPRRGVEVHCRMLRLGRSLKVIELPHINDMNLDLRRQSFLHWLDTR